MEKQREPRYNVINQAGRSGVGVTAGKGGNATHLEPGSGEPNSHRPHGASAFTDGEVSSAKAVNGATLAIIIAVSASLVLFLLILWVVYRHRQRRKDPLLRGDLTLDDIEGYTALPQLRRASSGCIHTDRPPATPRGKTLVRSLTVDNIPDFCLPPEKVQPSSPGDKNKTTSALQYQHSLLGNIKPDLYRFSEDDDDYDLPPSPAGRLWFALLYDSSAEQLTVTLSKAKHLPGRGKGKTPRDPFVKLYLLPDERTSQQSKIRRKTLSPKFNESFVFQVPPSEVQTRVLRMSVYDMDKRRVRHSLGHVILPLTNYDISRSDQEYLWRDLEPVSQNTTSLGEINFSLCHCHNTDKIKVTILRTKNLKKLDFDTDLGVYIKIQMRLGRKVIKTKKTSVQRGSSEPSYNECISFTVPCMQLDSANFAISVITASNKLIGHDQEYGRVVVGPFMFARGDELMHWQDMIAQPRTTITRWHNLQAP